MGQITLRCTTKTLSPLLLYFLLHALEGKQKHSAERVENYRWRTELQHKLTLEIDTSAIGG